MSQKICPDCGQRIDETPEWVRAVSAAVIVAVFIGIGYALAHLAWV